MRLLLVKLFALLVVLTLPDDEEESDAEFY